MEKVQKNMKFGRWTVLETDVTNPNSNRKQSVKWALCKCECGTIRYKEYRDLYSGRSKSCGCYTREQTKKRNLEKGKMEIGAKFGKLTVIEDLGLRKQNSREKMARWSRCKCECGNIIDVCNNNLRTNGTQSCGCVQSRGELLISQILRENNIEFSQQYSFPDLKGLKNRVLKFDFAIFKNHELFCLIEFQGRQHYEEADAIWNHAETLKERKYRDDLKKEYCEKNNIPLYCIPYYQFTKINIDYIKKIIKYEEDLTHE